MLRVCERLGSHGRRRKILTNVQAKFCQREREKEREKERKR